MIGSVRHGARRRLHRRVLASLLLFFGATVSPAVGQVDAVVGSWTGELLVPGGGQLTLVYNVEVADGGGLDGTMDSPDQGATGIPLSSVTYVDGALTMVVAAIPGAPTFEGTLSDDGEQLRGTFTQGGSLPLVLVRAEGPAEVAARPQDPQPPFPYRVEEVRFRSEAAGIELAGTLTVPDGPGPFPGAVLVTGSGPQDRDESLVGHRPFLVLADHLTRAGVAVLRFDDRGFGESEGDFGGATSEDFAEDALAAVDHLAGRADVARDRIGLIGHSEGGLSGPMAANRSESVAYVVMLAGPGVSGIEVLREQQALIARAAGALPPVIDFNRRVLDTLWASMQTEPDPAAAAGSMRAAMQAKIDELPPDLVAAAGDALGPALIDQTVGQLNTRWFRFFLGYDPVPALEALAVPVLALLGERDLQVPSGQNAPAIEAAFDRAGHPDATVRVLPGLNHLFQEARTGSPAEYAQIEQTMSPVALDAVSSWIVQRFGS